MTFLFILCPVALLAVILTNLIPAGNGGAETKERMERRGSANRSSEAPVAPKVKFGEDDTANGPDEDVTEEQHLPSAA